jgi:predicted nucleotide-binding protein (sugar kinase/HSP70/actin superfamily)
VNVKRVTYPHLGTLYVTVEHYFRSLGLAPVTPPFSSRRTLDLGVTHCPEMTCTPCKILFGNYYEGLEKGADLLVLFGGPDTCRLGYSARPQAERLRAAGYQFTPYTLSLKGIAADILWMTREMADPSPLELMEGARTLATSLSLVDAIDQEAIKLRPRERERGTASRLRNEALAAVRDCQDRIEIQARREEILTPLRTVPRRDGPAHRVALLGDLYSISEPFFNMNLEESLGYLGIEVDRWLWLSKYLRMPSLEGLLHRGDTRARQEEAGRYLSRDIGGFAYASVKEATAFVHEGVDGLVHLAPFNCTPEIVAASVLPQLSRDHDIPLLALSFDEHSGEAGLTTRLEAFVDLLERRAWRREPRQGAGPDETGRSQGLAARLRSRGGR